MSEQLIETYKETTRGRSYDVEVYFNNGRIGHNMFIAKVMDNNIVKETHSNSDINILKAEVHDDVAYDMCEFVDAIQVECIVDNPINIEELLDGYHSKINICSLDICAAEATIDKSPNRMWFSSDTSKDFNPIYKTIKSGNCIIIKTTKNYIEFKRIVARMVKAVKQFQKEFKKLE